MPKAKKKKGFTKRVQLFIKEYPKDLNATQTAIRAGFSKKTAYSQGSRLLKNVEVQRAIAKEFEERKKRIEVDADYVLTGFIEVAERCMTHKEVQDFDYQQKKLVHRKDENGKGVYEFDSKGANTALRNIGEHLGMFKKIHASDPDNPLFPPVNITVAKDDKKKK